MNHTSVVRTAGCCFESEAFSSEEFCAKATKVPVSSMLAACLQGDAAFQQLPWAEVLPGRVLCLLSGLFSVVLSGVSLWSRTRPACQSKQRAPGIGWDLLQPERESKLVSNLQ